MFGAHVLLLVGHHKDVLFKIVEEVYDHDRLKGENAVECTLSPTNQSGLHLLCVIQWPLKGAQTIAWIKTVWAKRIAYAEKKRLIVGRESAGRHAGREDVGGVGSLENCHGLDEVRPQRSTLISPILPIQRPVSQSTNWPLQKKSGRDSSRDDEKRVECCVRSEPRSATQMNNELDKSNRFYRY